MRQRGASDWALLGLRAQRSSVSRSVVGEYQFCFRPAPLSDGFLPSLLMMRGTREAGRKFLNQKESLAQDTRTTGVRTCVCSSGRPSPIGDRGRRDRLPGWINTDISRHAEAYLDLTKPWPLNGGKVWRIHGDNVIDRFDLATARIVLACLCAVRERLVAG
jgi:hypothetical protein